MESTGFLAAITVLAAVLLAFPYYGAKLYPTARPGYPAVVANRVAPVWQTRIYSIKGMTCEACARHVERAVQQVPGVQAVAVSYNQASAQVCFDATHAQPAQVERAINGTGYHVLNPTR